MYPTKQSFNFQALELIVSNFKDSVPTDVIENFKIEAFESGYDLFSKQGTVWYTERSVIADYFRNKQKEQTVTFNWGFEDNGPEGITRFVHIIGMDEYLELINDEMLALGIPAARKLTRKLAKKNGKVFIDETEKCTASDYRSALMTNKHWL